MTFAFHGFDTVDAAFAFVDEAQQVGGDDDASEAAEGQRADEDVLQQVHQCCVSLQATLNERGSSGRPAVVTTAVSLQVVQMSV